MICRGNMAGLEDLLLPWATLLLSLGDAGGRGLGGLVLLLPLGVIVGEDGPNRLFARGEVGGDVEECGRCGWYVPAQFSDQVSAGGAREECLDDFRVTDAGQLGAFLGEVPDEISKRFVRLLAATFEVPGVPEAHVGALEIPDEDPDQVALVVDL